MGAVDRKSTVALILSKIGTFVALKKIGDSFRIFLSI